MTDLAPLPPCEMTKRGNHALNAIIPGSDEGWVTLFCEACGIVRRFAVAGPLTGTLDELTAAEIERRIFGRA